MTRRVVGSTYTLRRTRGAGARRDEAWEAWVRSWARRSIGVVAVAAIALTVVCASAASALSPAPGEGQPASPGICVWAFTPAAADGGMEPGSVSVSITSLPTIDESLTVQLFLDGNVVQSRVVTPPPGLPVDFAPITVADGDSVSVNYILRSVSTYSTVCATVGGESVVRVRALGAQASRLAFTGSSHTSTMVLVAVAALVLGLVLVVGARRRRHVNA
jgi:LPXTG-motif cell wall-anchored protein